MKKKWVSWLVAFGLIGLLIWQTDTRQIWQQLQQIQAVQLLLLFVVNVLVLAVLNGRWYLLLRHHGYQVPFWRLWGIRLIGAAVSYFTPGPQFGGEPVQVYLLVKQEGVGKETAVTTVALDRTLELIVNFTFLLVGILLSTRYLGGQLNWLAVGLALALLSAPVLLLVSITWGYHPLSWVISQIPKCWSWLSSMQTLFYQSEQQIATFCRASPFILALVLFISFLGWLGIVCEYWLMVRILGIPLGIGEGVVALTAVRLAILLPVPSGLGTIETSQFLAMQSLGVSAELGLSLSLLIRARDLFFNLGGVFLGRQKISVKMKSEPL